MKILISSKKPIYLFLEYMNFTENLLIIYFLLNINLLLFSIMEKKISKKLNLNDYQILTTIGTGSFGRVKLTKHKSTAKYYALKILKKNQIIKSKQVDHVMNENQILTRVHHPFIVNTEGFTQDKRYLYVVLQFISGGQLFNYLRGIGKFSPEQALFYSAQVVLIFQYLHSKHIIYRDLKPENLLIAQDGYLKLTDFGFAKLIEDRTFTLCGTPEYMAPEILLNQGHGKAADWWTLGILIYEMNAGIDPFTDEDPMNIYQNILKCKLKFPRDFDKDAKLLVKNLLVIDLSKRIGNLKKGAEDIKCHRWYQKLDWNKLINKKQMAYYKPTIKKPGDISHFATYPDSDTQCPAIKPSDDPFLNW